MSTGSGKPENSQPAPDQAGFARVVVWVLRTQAVLAAVAGIIAGLVAGVASALALLAGGGIGIVLTAVAALRTGAVSDGPVAMAAAFYRGMLMKMALAVVLFVVVAMLFAEWFVPVLAGYAVTLVAYWVALLRIGRETGSRGALNDE